VATVLVIGAIPKSRVGDHHPAWLGDGTFGERGLICSVLEKYLITKILCLLNK
jgi:hypothetical protein